MSKYISSMRLMRINLRLLFRSRSFWLSVLGMVICNALPLWTYMASLLSDFYTIDLLYNDARNEGAIYLLTAAQGGSSFLLVTNCVLPLFPFACQLMKQIQDKAHYSYLLRVSPVQYVITNYLVCILSGGLILFLGQILFVSILCIFVPLNGLTDITGTAYDIFLGQGKPIAFLLYYVLHVSFSGVLFAAIGFTVSAFVNSKFVAYSLPVVIYYFLLQVTSFIPEIPAFLRPNCLVELIYPLSTPAATLLLKSATVLGFCFALGAVAMIKNLRRMKNG